MHEGSLMRDVMRVIESIADDQGARAITGVRVRLGALAHFSVDHFREHFEQASAATRAAGAILDVTLSDDIHDPRAQDVVVESIDVELGDPS